MSEIETYLRETGCDLQIYREHLAAGFSVGTAFANSLDVWDIILLQNSNRFFEIKAETEIDSPKLIETLAYLRSCNALDQ